jgi:hypothetical protein
MQSPNKYFIYIQKAKMRGAKLTEWNNSPRHVKPNIIHPVIEKLGATVRYALEPVGRVIQCHAIQMRDAHDDLEAVSCIPA